MPPGTCLPALSEVEVNVTGFLTTHHCFETKAGACPKLTFPAFGDHGTLRMADERELKMHKRSHDIHWLGSAHELVERDTVRGWADRRGLLHREIVLQFDGQEHLLEPEGLSSLGGYLTDMAGNRLLEIQPRGIFCQEFCLTFRGAIDADLIAFAYYLVHTRPQEDAAAAPATTAAAASQVPQLPGVPTYQLFTSSRSRRTENP